MEEKIVLSKKNFEEWYNGTTKMMEQSARFPGGIAKGDEQRGIPDKPIFWYDEVTQEEHGMTGYSFTREDGHYKQHIDLLDHAPIDRILK